MPGSTPETATVTLDQAELRERLGALLTAVGVPRGDAAGIAEILVLADLRGVESHGVRFAPRYVRGLARGLVNPRPRLEFVHGRGGVAVMDADNGLGFVAARRAMERAIELAAEHGLGSVAVRGSNHFGMAGFYAMQAVEAGMVGHATTNGPPHTVVWGGREPMVCNDPIAWAFPTATPPAIVVDTALTGVKEKIRLAAEQGRAIPADWAVGPDGSPTTDPAVALEGALLPIGGHKGSALIVANEMLSAALPGALFSYAISPAIALGSDHHDRWGCGHLTLALDVAAFGDPDAFRRRADELAGAIRRAKPARGVERVYVPGELEWLTMQERLANGLPLAAGSLEMLDAVAAEVGATTRFTDLGS